MDNSNKRHIIGQVRRLFDGGVIDTFALKRGGFLINTVTIL